MPKRKVSKTLSKKQSLMELMQKPELWIGVFTIGVLLGVGSGVVIKNKPNLTLSKMMKQTKVISPVPTSETSPTPVAKKLPQIKKLAFTSSTIMVEVKENDSFWTIAKRVCGDGRYYWSLQALNEDQTLHAGDVVKVNCN